MENNGIRENIKVSVVIALKDKPKNLKRCLEAWDEVWYPNLEFILVDDGSKDDYLWNVYFDFIDRHESARVLRLESDHDRTPAVAFNTGFKASTGDFVIFTDEDLIFGCPDLVKRMLNNYHEGHRVTLKTFFLDAYHTDLLDGIDWIDHPQLLHTLGGFWEYYRYDAQTTNKWLFDHWHNPVVTFLTGQYRKDWEYIGLFREDKSHLTRDQDIVMREIALNREATTLPKIACYHQYHPFPQVYVAPGYRYENENQARLLEPAPPE